MSCIILLTYDIIVVICYRGMQFLPILLAPETLTATSVQHLEMSPCRFSDQHGVSKPSKP